MADSDEGSTGESYELWIRLIRRAFEVPEIITDENAVSAITYGFIGDEGLEPEDSTASQLQQLNGARALVRDLTQLGADGALDRYVVRCHRTPKQWDEAARDSLAIDLCNRSEDIHDYVRTVATGIVSQVIDFARALVPAASSRD